MCRNAKPAKHLPLYYKYHAYFINFAYDFYTTYEFPAIYATPNAKNYFCSHRLWYTMEKGNQTFAPSLKHCRGK